jgi:lysozyme family protein
MNYQTTINSIILNEGGYVNHPADRGGPTNFGITQATARLNGYMGDMKDLPRTIAEKIYRLRYIINPGFDKVATLSEATAEELIDTGVLMGPATASTYFQRLLNVMNQQGSKYADIFVDGQIGPVTIAAFKAYLDYRKEGATVMVKALNNLQGARFVELAEKNPSQESFVYGWLKNRT